MEERRNEILKELDRKGRVKVTDLSKEFGCSEVTIRNDIKAMDIEGLLKRTHGGAVKVETETERKYSAETIYRNVTQKKQMNFWMTGIRSLLMMHQPAFTLHRRLRIIRRSGSQL